MNTLLGYVPCNGLFKTFFLVSLTVNTHKWNVNLALDSLWAMSSDLAFP